MRFARELFFHLPVGDVATSRAFFEGLGFLVDEARSDERTACLAMAEGARVVLLERERFAAYATLPPADPRCATGSIVALAAPDRAGVDALADAALAAGATAANAPEEHAGGYGRSFLDFDGHHWEVIWMAP